MRRKVQKLFNQATGDWSRYKDALTTYSNTGRAAKRNSFKEFSERIKQTTKTLKLYKAIAMSE